MQQVLSTIITLLIAFVNLVSAILGGLPAGTETGTETDTTVPPEPTSVVVEEDTTRDDTSNPEDMIWPLKKESKVITGYPNYADGSYHGGIDISLTSGSSLGEPFYASASGIVLLAYNDGNYNDGFGNYCTVDHGNGLVTLYAHAKDLTVIPGEYVSQGDMLGHIGQTGNATAPHLHFEVRKVDANGKQTRVNPLDYVKNPYDKTTDDRDTPSTPTTPVTPADPGKLTGKFTFTVYGYGHGVGMSQEGAIAMAKSGSSCSDILYHYYPGTKLATDKSTPSTVTKNGKDIPLIEFLCRTVKQEIGPGAPMEALKAQAICAYTYSMTHGYGSGQAYDSSYSYSGTNVEKAVLSVLGNYLSYNGKPAGTYYFASAAGKTASASSVWGGESIPYLEGGITSPEKVDISTKEYTAKEMYDLIQSYASSSGKKITLGSNPADWLKIISHDSAYSSSIGYVSKISVGGITMSGNAFRSNVLKLKIKSHCFTVVYTA